jgi:adenosine deaminase
MMLSSVTELFWSQFRQHHNADAVTATAILQMKDHSTQFIQALIEGDIVALRRVPKADLHCHFCNSGNRRFIEQAAGVSVPPVTKPLATIQEMHEWVQTHIGPLFDTAQKRTLASQALFVQAAEDGIAVLETGEDVWARTALYGGSVESIIGILKQAHDRFAPRVIFRPQIGLSRHCSIDSLEEWLVPFLESDYFTCMDLYCDESAQPIRNFKGIYRKARDKGLKLKAHVGEWGSADSVKEAVEELELHEVQHGIAAAESVAVMKWLSDHQIQLNICPTSNVMLGRVASLRRHPARALYDHGVRLTVNSDDVLVFGHSVSDEFMSLYQSGLFTADELDTIRINGLTSRKDGKDIHGTAESFGISDDLRQRS